MAAGEDPGEDEVDQFLLPEEHLVEAAGEGSQMFSGTDNFGFGGVFHEVRFKIYRKLTNRLPVGMKIA